MSLEFLAWIDATTVFIDFFEKEIEDGSLKDVHMKDNVHFKINKLFYFINHTYTLIIILIFPKNYLFLHLNSNILFFSNSANGHKTT